MSETTNVPNGTVENEAGKFCPFIQGEDFISCLKERCQLWIDYSDQYFGPDKNQRFGCAFRFISDIASYLRGRQ